MLGAGHRMLEGDHRNQAVAKEIHNLLDIRHIDQEEDSADIYSSGIRMSTEHALTIDLRVIKIPRRGGSTRRRGVLLRWG